MRLINADELEKEIEGFFLAITGNPKQTTVVRECKKSFEQMIDDQPTAFDLDKVVQQLEEIEKKYPYKQYGKPETYDKYNEGWCDCIDMVIGIVKKGGIA